MHPLRMHYDKLLLAVAFVALLGSLDWVRRQHTGSRLLDTGKGNSGFYGTAVAQAERKETAAIVPVWPVPQAQRQGDSWIYDVFTPPLVQYNSAKRAFVLVPTELRAGVPDAKVVSSEPLPEESAAFRLQLMGYIGSPDDCLVVFQSPQSAHTLMVRVGHRFADLDLTLKAFTVRKVLVRETESGPVYEAAALATLFDERSRQEVVLDSRTKPFTAPPVAQRPSNPEPLPEIESRRVAVTSP
jgi:hypothetical protein